MSRADNREDGAVLEQREDSVPPADAFSIVSNETRLATLEALWTLETPARFSDIRAAVDMDDSAQFNYHLDKLTGQFVRKTDGGYELRTAGARVVQSVLAGSFTEQPRRTLDIDDPCTQCGQALSAEYCEGQLRVSCPECGHAHAEYSFPPGGLRGRSDEEVLAAFDQRVRHLHCLAKDGVCPECGGPTRTTIEDGDDCCLGASIRAEYVCQRCGQERCSALGLGLLDQSRVVAFCESQGIAVSETPFWRFDWCVSDDPVHVRTADPPRLDVDITLGGETLRVTVDDDLTILETDRR